MRLGFGFGSAIFQAAQRPLAGGSTPINGGAAFSTDTRTGTPFTYTQPKTAPTTGGILSAAQHEPGVTSMNALTSCPATSMGGAYPDIPLTGSLACAIGMGPLLTGSGATSTLTVFPFTTGTVIAQQTSNNAANAVGDLVTLSGSDARTARGVGNITLVAGNLVIRRAISTTTNVTSNQYTLTLSEKTPSVTPVGLAAAALLMLLAAGYGLRSRF